jgi:hypothetical protein
VDLWRASGSSSGSKDIDIGTFLADANDGPAQEELIRLLKGLFERDSSYAKDRKVKSAPPT